MIEETSIMETTTGQPGALRRRRIEADLSDDDIRRLDERARSAGIDRAECAGQLLRRALAVDSEEQDLHAGMTFAEILAPVHKEFAESGMTEEELHQFFEEVREDVWREKQREKNGP
jgi:hypothetical protein